MAELIKNIAVLTYNDTQTADCEVTVLVDTLPEVHKRAYTNSQGVIFDSGTVDDRIINYEIEVINYSSQEKNNVVVLDSFRLPAPYENSFSILEANYPYEIQAEGILFNVGSLAQGTRLLVIYTVQLGEDVPSSVDIHNYAEIDYEQKSEDTSIQTEELIVTTSDPVTPPHPDPPQPDPVVPIVINGTKSAPSKVLCGESFSYGLSFPNNNEVTVPVVEIIDELPDQFVMMQAVVSISGADKTAGVDYTISQNAQKLSIEAIESGLDIEPGQELQIKITGYIRYNI